jgi:hypothetical protein
MYEGDREYMPYFEPHPADGISTARLVASKLLQQSMRDF